MDLSSWPVNNVASCLLDADGEVIDSYGDTDRVFELASVTKLLSAYGLLMAIEEGVFELDDQLGPEGSTVRHLLAHASGVAFDSKKSERDVEERRIYSSAGFEWLGEALEEESGIKFGEYLQEGVFAPLGMENTEVYGSPGHDGRSTVKDFVQFLREVQNPKLLAASTVREALTPQFPELDGIVPGYGMQKPNTWGLGFELKGGKQKHWTGPTMPEETAGHFGMAGTFAWIVPDRGAMVTFTDHEFGEWAKPLWSDFNEEIFNKLSWAASLTR